MSYYSCNFDEEEEEEEEVPAPSTVAALYDLKTPETRRITKITGFTPKSHILQAVADNRKIQNNLQGPAKDIPSALVRDFVSGRRNAVMCLNEYSQLRRVEYKFQETAPSVATSYSGRPVFAFYVNVKGEKYPIGEGTNKKEAKGAAAKNALNKLLELNCDNRLEDSQDKQSHLYGPKFNVKPVTLPPPSENNGQMYNPSPLITRIMNTHEISGKLSNDHVQKLLHSFPKLLAVCYQTSFAAVIVKREGQQGQIVAIGAGDGCYSGSEQPNDGSLVFDSHSEVIARRAFRRYLINELWKWNYVQSSTPKESSIFGTAENTQLLHLRDDVTIHMYFSKQPKGFAREFVRTQNYVEHIYSGKTTGTDDGNLRYITDGGKTCEVILANDKMNNFPKNQNITMSATDKLTLWASVGLQGAALSLFVEPIYLTSITIGGSIHGSTPPGKLLSYPINNRVDDILGAEFPGYYINNPIEKIEGYRGAKPFIQTYDDIEDISLNWTLADTKVEVVNISTGKDETGVSRISKVAFFGKIKQLDEKYENPIDDLSKYIAVKDEAASYMITKQYVVKNLESNKFGKWRSRSRSVDMFSTI